MITDAHLEQLLRDERDSFGEPDAALLDRVVEVPVFDSPEQTPPRRRRVRSLLVGFALLVPLVVAVVVAASRRSDPAVEPAAATTATVTAVAVPLHDQLVGTWQLEGIDTNAYRDRAVVRFDANGTWSGSDGCNDLSGTWRVAADGAFAADSGFQSAVGCDNVNYAEMLHAARRVEVDGNRLVFHASHGGVTVNLVRDPLALPNPPAAGWLPGYSFFQADRVVTDQALIDRFAAMRRTLDPTGSDRTPPVVWYLGRVAGLDDFLVVYRPEAICMLSIVVQNNRNAGGGCTARDAMQDPLSPPGDGSGFVVADAVRSVVAESADGVKTEYRVRDNFAFGDPKTASKHLVVTLADGRARDTLEGVVPDTPASTGTTGVPPATGGIADFPGIATAPETTDQRVLDVVAAARLPTDTTHVKQIATTDFADYYLAYGDGDTACSVAIVRATGQLDRFACGLPSADRPTSLFRLATKVSAARLDYLLLAPVGVVGVTVTEANGKATTFGFGPATPGSPSARDNAAVGTVGEAASAQSIVKVTIRYSDGTESSVSRLDFK